MKGAVVVVAVAVAFSFALGADADSGTTGGNPRAVRGGGVNAMPSMRPWRYRGANPDGWWCTPGKCNGVANGTGYLSRELPLMATLGAQSVRVEFPWALIQPQRGRFDWKRADAIVRTARRQHLALQPVLVYSPSWAAPTASSPPSAAAFSRFAHALARRYRGRIRTYELWNEPDLQRYWSGTTEQYVQRILIPGHRAIRSADRNARVLLGAPSKADRDWLEGIYRYGGGSSFEIAAFHDYAPGPAVFDDARVVASVLAEHGQAGKPIWLGEYGYPDSDPSSPHQIPLIEQVLTSPGPIAMAQWYSFRDTYTASCCPPQVIGFSPWGLVTAGYDRKASFGIMQALLGRG
jgi:hypothetical protein